MVEQEDVDAPRQSSSSNQSPSSSSSSVRKRDISSTGSGSSSGNGNGNGNGSNVNKIMRSIYEDQPRIQLKHYHVESFWDTVGSEMNENQNRKGIYFTI